MADGREYRRPRSEKLLTRGEAIQGKERTLLRPTKLPPLSSASFRIRAAKRTTLAGMPP